MKLLRWAVLVLAAVVLVVFAVANRQWVEVSAWPVLDFEAPLYLVVLLALLLGFFIGEFVAWANGGRLRRTARERARRISALERELAATQTLTTTPAQPAAAAEPAPRAPLGYFPNSAGESAAASARALPK